MKNWNKFPRLILFITLLVGMLAGLSAPVFVEESISAAPMAANALDVVISEVAWAGTSGATTNDEWIELYNPTGLTINLSGWLLQASDGVPSISLTGIIPPGGYYLIERDDNATVSDVLADQLYTGALGNAGETLTLTDNLSNVIDTANISGGGWDAGTAGTGPVTYASMERVVPIVVDSALAWTTNNGVTRNGLDANNNPINGTPRNSQVDLSLTKIVDNATPNIGNNVVFTITVTNGGPNNATNVTVRDLLPAGLTYVSDNSGGAYNNGTGIWTVGTITNGASATLQITANVATGGIKTNSAEVWSADQIDSDSTAGNSSTTEDDDASVTVTPPGPILTLNITNVVNNPTPAIGSNVVFTITVNNPSTNATGVAVNALLPAGLTYVSHFTTTGAYVSGSGVWTIGNLAGGASATLNLTARVVTSGTKNYSATVSSNEYANSTAVATVNPVASTQADLSLSQTWNRSTSAADTAELSITVENQSLTNTATGVQVKDLLPSGLTYVSHTTGMTYSNSTGIWVVGTLAGGASSTLVITVRVAASGTSTSNFAEIWLSDQFDTDSTPGNGDTTEDDDTSAEVLIADLSLTEIVDISGSNAIFTITVRNAGPDDASGIIVKNSRLATSYTFVSAGSTAGSSYNSGTGDWTIPTLLDGASATLTVTTTTLGTLPVNWAQVSSVNEVDPDSLPNNCSSTVASCTEDDDAGAPAADLFLAQSVNNLNPNVDTNIVFTITVGNAGVAGATNVQVKDILPSGLTYVSDSGGGTYNKTSGIWTVGTLASGANKSLNITAKVTNNGIKTNLAEVWKSDESDPDSIPGNSSTTEDDDADATITSFRSIIINEVAWAGTGSSATLANDEWIELYNPSNAAINITGWTLISASLNITLSGTIPAGGYFLLERDDNTTVSDVTADQIYTSAAPLSDSGEVITLRTASGSFIDTANNENGGSWPRGTTSPNFATMERNSSSAEKDSSWITNTGVTKNGKNASGGAIFGTPKKANSRVTTPFPTSIPIPTPTPTLLPVFGRPIISEILPRPGFDWNQDGKVDVFDEFIEVKNLGPVDINIKGWKLDDLNSSFTLPDIILKPGQHVVFYGLQTNILLSDGGETVRLLNPSSKIYDAYTYSIAKVEDESICRLPDTDIFGDWYEDCTPTPNLTNTREGFVPSMPGGGFESPVCELPDTLPADFLFAECRGYGANIWDSFYWDKDGWQGDQYVPENMSKWESFVE
ncbi:MAG: DUF11 domain-containing protein [Anaerolineales bacterium]|nr:DUF11 domain-containing protein [Anaerolineales bacterium]